MSFEPETDEFKEEPINQQKFDNFLDIINNKETARKMILQLGFTCQKYWNDPEKKSHYMKQLQGLYNAYGNKYNECVYGVAKLVPKK